MFPAVRVTDAVDGSARDSVGTTGLEPSRCDPPASSLINKCKVVNDDESRKVPAESPTEG